MPKVHGLLLAGSTFAILNFGTGLAGALAVPVLIAQAPAPAEPANPAAATSGRPATTREFEPPPMPEFMLRKPAQPLSQEEMQRQADEAAERVRKAKAASGAGSAPASQDAGSSAAGSGASPR